MGGTTKEVEAGQAVYSRFVLSVYDWWVLGVSNRYIWKCPTDKMLQLYNEHITANHLDVGVGTGYYLDRCQFPATPPNLALLDLNPNSLATTTQRVSRFKPVCYQHNALEPLNLNGASFDSIGVNYLFHCLPGNIQSKSIVFDHLKRVLNSGGVIFGSTLLQEGVTRGKMARKLMQIYNKNGIFSNTEDSLEALKTSLAQQFETFEVEVVGCAALFWGLK